MTGLSQSALPHNTQQSQETDVHAKGGTLTRNTCKRATANPYFRTWRPSVSLFSSSKWKLPPSNIQNFLDISIYVSVNLEFVCGFIHYIITVGIATRYGLDGPGSSPGEKILRTRPELPWGPISLLHNGYPIWGWGYRNCSAIPLLSPPLPVACSMVNSPFTLHYHCRSGRSFISSDRF